METAQDQIVTLAQGISDHAQATKNKDAVITLSTVDNKVAAALGGTTENMVKLLASVMNREPQVARIFKLALQAAPFIEIMETLEEMASEDDDTPCDCPNCIERRRQAAADPNIN